MVAASILTKTSSGYCNGLAIFSLLKIQGEPKALAITPWVIVLLLMILKAKLWDFSGAIVLNYKWGFGITFPNLKG
jgi:hypothetical protein